MNSIVADFFESYSFQTFDKKLRIQGMTNAYVSDGIDFYNVVRKYVGNYFAVHYARRETCIKDKALMKWYRRMNELSPGKDLPRALKCDDIVDVISTYLVAVSAVHSHVGNVGTFFTGVCFAPFSFRENSTCGVPRDTMYALNTLLGTDQYSNPKLVDDFTFMFDDQKSKDTWREFQKDLLELDGIIVQRNIERAVPFYGFLPSIIEISTSY
jgi:hypothetical protein